MAPGLDPVTVNLFERRIGDFGPWMLDDILGDCIVSGGSNAEERRAWPSATAAHLACDFGNDTGGPTRPDLHGACLSVDGPTAIALSNDHLDDTVFTKQSTTPLDPSDVVIAISASGASPNIVAALDVARGLGATVIGLLGFDGGPSRARCDDALVVPSFNCGQVEDTHLIVGHVLAQYLRQRLALRPHEGGAGRVPPD
jgi:D-sedoheptulose 7-phosphate isomerase